MADVAALAHCAGDRVSKDLDLLVVAESEALSGKASRGGNGKEFVYRPTPERSKANPWDAIGHNLGG